MSEMGETKERLQGKDPSDVWQDLLVENPTDSNLRVALVNGVTVAKILTTGTDALLNTQNQLIEAALGYGFNETEWDRWRNNTELTVLPSATRTTSGSTADLTNYNARGVFLYINITAVSGTNPVLDIEIRGTDPVSGSYQCLVIMDGISSGGSYILIAYPGATESGTAAFWGTNVEAGDLPLPRTWRLRYSIGGTNPSFTFSVGGCYVV